MLTNALRSLATTSVVLGMLAISPPAIAGGTTSCTSALGVCVQGTTPGDPGSTPSAGGGSTGGSSACVDASGNSIPCFDGTGYWNPAPYDCYVYAITPQPVASDPVWRFASGGGPTASPATGSIWGCYYQAATDFIFFPNGRGAVNPATAAQALKATAPFATANANIAPPPTFHTYVHYLNWLWVDPAQWKNVTVTLAVGGANVTLTGTPKYATWTMGNGATQVCDSPGDVWTPGTPNDAQSDCQYAYNTMTSPYGDRWTIRAQITYGLAWSCAGACGGQMAGTLPDITANAGKSASITVYQRRAVITG